MAYLIEFNEEKNLLLKTTRGVNFEDVIDAIIKNKVIDDLRHAKKGNQRIMAVKIKKYIYAVPYVTDKIRNVIFLKTVYPSRLLTKKYLQNQKYVNSKTS